MTIEKFAPAKVNLALHVTDRHADGYHELDSLVVFADIGDVIRVEPSDEMRFAVTGPMANGVPVDDSNLVMKAAQLAGVTADITLEKHLPRAAGLGGGSGDAAATWKALQEMGDIPQDRDVTSIGADVAVCMADCAARMQGIGDKITPISGLPVLHAVLVNPNLPVMTADVFRRLENPNNPPMPEQLPQDLSDSDFIAWLKDQRNDLQAPAMTTEPIIEQVFSVLEVTPGCQLTRMSGSGGTCFGLYQDEETAAAAAGRLRENHPGWWVAATRLNAH